MKAYVYHDGKRYCVRCTPVDVFTQGKTLDEAVMNVKEAVALHLEDPEARCGLPKDASLLMIPSGGALRRHGAERNRQRRGVG